MSLTKVSYSMVTGAPLNVLDFGADPTGTTNSAVAIQAAFDTYGNTAGTGKFVDVYFPIGTYLVNTELVTNGANIIGESLDTIIKASSAIRSCIKMRGQQSRIANITVDANSLADNCIYVGDDINNFGTNSALITGCKLQYAKYDGLLFSTNGNHNNFVVDRSLIWLHGTTYNTGTATTTGTTLVTISGAADLTTFVRPMYDYIHVSGETLPRAIIAVTATTLTVNPAFTNTVASAGYSIHQGSGVCIMSQGDNSEIKIQNSVLNLNKLAGLDDHALYGAESFNNVIEGNSLFGRIIGRNGATPHYPFSAGDLRNYYEANPFSDIRIEAGLNARIDITGETSLALISLNSGDSTVYNGLTYVGNGQTFDSELVQPLNPSTVNLEFGKTYITNCPGAAEAIFNLPVSTSTNETAFRTKMTSKISVALTNLNGQGIRFRSATGTVNGVAGSTGVLFSTNYSAVDCYFDGLNWTIG